MIKGVKTEEARLFCNIFIISNISIGGALPPPGYAFARRSNITMEYNVIYYDYYKPYHSDVTLHLRLVFFTDFDTSIKTLNIQ